MVVLATVLVHITSLANQRFYSTLMVKGRGYVKKATLCCTLVKTMYSTLGD